jgi:hypothetical protein
MFPSRYRAPTELVLFFNVGIYKDLAPPEPFFNSPLDYNAKQKIEDFSRFTNHVSRPIAICVNPRSSAVRFASPWLCVRFVSSWLVACNGLDRRVRFCATRSVDRSASMSSPDAVSSDASEVRFLTARPVLDGLVRVIIGSLTLLAFIYPSSILAQYTETKIGEYLNYAVAATNGSVYALKVPAPGLVGYSDFSKGATAAVVSRPRHAATFVLKANGAFNCTPKAGFGGHNDYFTYHLINSFGTSVTGTVTIGVGAAP